MLRCPPTLPVLVGPLLAANFLRAFAHLSSQRVVTVSLGLLVGGDFLFAAASLTAALGLGWFSRWLFSASDGEFRCESMMVRRSPPSILPTPEQPAEILSFLPLGSEALPSCCSPTPPPAILRTSLGDQELSLAVAAGDPRHPTDYAATFSHMMIVVTIPPWSRGCRTGVLDVGRVC